MSNESIALNRFDPKTTKTVLIHDGRFHADDMMFSALAMVAAEKYRNSLTIKRVNKLPLEYCANTVAGDIGMGVYDHHNDIDGTVAIGARNNTADKLAASCGLLYQDVKSILFPGDSETKKVFEAFLDVVEHCDNTPDNNTFSDSVNLFTPIDDDKLDESARQAMLYCKAVVNGFIDAHEKEKSGKIWAVPRVCSGIVPGVQEKKDSRYWKASNQIKKRYKYVSFNDLTDMKLRSMDMYSLACGVLNQKRRQYWRDEIERRDAEQIKEMERREREDWPKAVSAMQNRTIYLDKYMPYGSYVKDLSALFIVMPSQRNGYTVTILKTNTGKYRFDPNLLIGFEGCSFVANDKRFLFFDKEEQAINAAHTAGRTVDRYIQANGFNAYREIYGGCANGYTGDFYQDLLSEDIALNLYAKENIDNLNSLTIADLRKLQIAIANNPYLIHAFCMRFQNVDNMMSWKTDVAVADIPGLSKETLRTKTQSGGRWDIGLQSYLETAQGQHMAMQIRPRDLIDFQQLLR